MQDELDRVVETALRQAYAALDALVSACTDDSGRPKAPSTRDIMAARKMLPPAFKSTLQGPK